MLKLGLVIVVMSLSWDVQADVLKQFDTDLCTFYREGTREEPMLWAHCCIKHDMAFWMAGTKEDRKKADLRLKSCVSEVAGERQGKLMYRAVRLGRFSPVRSKYGWGWPWKKGLRKRYDPLTDQQRAMAIEMIQEADIDPILISEFLEDIRDE